MIPFDAKRKDRQDQHYMCAAVTFAVHTETKLGLAFALVHFYSKKSFDPQATLLEYLQRRSADYDAVVWGGDCNHVYRQAPAGYVWEEASQHRPTRRASGKKIDWIFATAVASSPLSDVPLLSFSKTRLAVSCLRLGSALRTTWPRLSL